MMNVQKYKKVSKVNYDSNSPKFIDEHKGKEGVHSVGGVLQYSSTVQYTRRLKHITSTLSYVSRMPVNCMHLP
jgi:hypothetical protein